jgi:putative transposase
MKYDNDQYRHKSIRLKGYDYTQSGAYFVTICSQDKKNLFSQIVDGNVILNEFGKIIENEWVKTGQIRKNVIIDEYVIMPNHLHGIIIIKNDHDDRRGTLRHADDRNADDYNGTLQRASTSNIESFGKPVFGSLPTIVRSFKSTTTKQINELRNMPEIPLWQRNYYEHVVRNDDDLNEIREYIINNPLKWDLDKENPSNINQSNIGER